MKWGKVKVGDCCEVTSSKRIFFSEYVDSGVPFYRSKEIIESSNGQAISEPLFISQEKYDEIKNHFGVPQSGDMLLTSVGTIGVPYIVRKKDYFYFKDGNLTWFRNFSDELDSKYLYFWVKSSEGQSVLNNTTIGSSQKALTIASLKGLEIPCPPAPVQKRIVEFLAGYDDLIENNQKQIKLLEEAAQRLYKEWFVDLRFPGHENVKITDGVPEGWHVVKLFSENLSTQDIRKIKAVAVELLQKVKSKIAELDHWTDKQETRSIVYNLIRDDLWSELPACYDDPSIPVYLQRIYEYVYKRYKEVA